MRKNLLKKLKESSFSVLPITIIVLIICLTMLDVSGYVIGAFLIGSVFLIIGIGLFTLGVDMAIMPIGESMGANLTKSKNLFIITAICFLMGILITIAEPDLAILANQIIEIPNVVIISAVALGVGIMVAIFVLKIFFKLKLSYILIGLYSIVFILSFFVKKDFVSIGYDAGGVTTGPMTVPFIMALCLGLAAVRSGDSNRDDSFGMVSLCLIGPIISVLILGLFYEPSNAASTNDSLVINSIKDMVFNYLRPFPSIMFDVAISLLPIIVVFLLFQVFTLKLPKTQMIRITIGVLYNFMGLSLFFLGANAGFLPIAKIIGASLALKSYNWILIIIGVVLGFVVVLAEPAVPVLNKQVEEVTGGAISRKVMLLCMCIGIAISVGLSMVRVLTGISLLYFVIPGYVIALILAFFVPSIFTGIAFDAGAVASGPITAIFMLPLAMGASHALGGNVYTDAFGLVIMVAMAPTVTIQFLGLIYNIKSKAKKVKVEYKEADMLDEPIDFDTVEIIDKEIENFENNTKKNSKNKISNNVKNAGEEKPKNTPKKQG